MLHRYGAEQLPTEVSSALLDYFFKKPAKDIKLNDPQLSANNHVDHTVIASGKEPSVLIKI